MAELADALDSGSSDSNVVEVQVLLPAPEKSTYITNVSAFFNEICRFASSEICGEIRLRRVKYSLREC